jgi:hypothetical protein
MCPIQAPGAVRWLPPALVQAMTLLTRKVHDFAPNRVALLDAWAASTPR